MTTLLLLLSRVCLVQVIVKSGPGTFLSLAVYDDYIFWSDGVRRAILRSSKYTGGDTKVLRSDIPHQPMGIIAVANDTNSCKWHSLAGSSTVHVRNVC